MKKNGEVKRKKRKECEKGVAWKLMTEEEMVGPTEMNCYISIISRGEEDWKECKRKG